VSQYTALQILPTIFVNSSIITQIFDTELFYLPIKLLTKPQKISNKNKGESDKTKKGYTERKKENKIYKKIQ
jgi:hypothetical protein